MTGNEPFGLDPHGDLHRLSQLPDRHQAGGLGRSRWKAGRRGPGSISARAATTPRRPTGIIRSSASSTTAATRPTVEWYLGVPARLDHDDRLSDGANWATGSKVWADPVIADQVVYFSTLRGSIEAVNPCVNLGEAGRLYARYIRYTSAIPVGGTAFKATAATPPEYLDLISKARRAVTVGEAERVARPRQQARDLRPGIRLHAGEAGAAHRLAPADQVLAGDLQDHLVRLERLPPAAFDRRRAGDDNRVGITMKKVFVVHRRHRAWQRPSAPRAWPTWPRKEKARRESLKGRHAVVVKNADLMRVQKVPGRRDHDSRGDRRRDRPGRRPGRRAGDRLGRGRDPPACLPAPGLPRAGASCPRRAGRPADHGRREPGPGRAAGRSRPSSRRPTSCRSSDDQDGRPSPTVRIPGRHGPRLRHPAAARRDEPAAPQGPGPAGPDRGADRQERHGKKAPASPSASLDANAHAASGS